MRVTFCMYICMYDCSHISKTTRSNFTKFAVHVGLIFLWRRCDMLCTSGFADVMLSATGRMARHVYADNSTLVDGSGSWVGAQLYC